MLAEICALALTGAIAALVISQIKGTFSFAVRIGTLIVTLGVLIALASSVFGELYAFVGESAEINRYAGVILKALGLALLGHFSSLICKELGSESLSFCVELAAKLEIFVLCLPVIKEIMGYAMQILEI